MVLQHPQINPVIFSLGPIKPTWYGMMYVVGFVLSYWLACRRAEKRPALGWNKDQLSDLLFWFMLGTIVGGRLGYILFYFIRPFGWIALFDDPLIVFRIHDGGMSFHGGLIGVSVACIAYALKYRRQSLDIGDYIGPFVPIGLFFGRIGNFINGELWGRPTEVPWAMVFPTAPDLLPRHPSQLYQAFWEGFVLFILLNWYAKKPRKRGRVTGLFLIAYSIGRFLIEFVREKDAQMSYYFFDLFTMGQLLTVPMVVVGLWLFFRPNAAAARPFNTEQVSS